MPFYCSDQPPADSNSFRDSILEVMNDTED